MESIEVPLKGDGEPEYTAIEGLLETDDIDKLVE